MTGPIQRVNVDLASGMLKELDTAAKEDLVCGIIMHEVEGVSSREGNGRVRILHRCF